MEDLWNYAEKVAAEELKDKHPTSFAPTDPASLQQTIDQLNAALRDKTKIPCIPIQPTPLLHPSIWKILNNSCLQRDQNLTNAKYHPKQQNKPHKALFLQFSILSQQ